MKHFLSTLYFCFGLSLSLHVHAQLALDCSNLPTAQICEQFDTGSLGGLTDFSMGNFTTVDGQLQLNATEAGLSAIGQSFSFTGILEWRFYFDLGFSPSGNNQLIAYLGVADYSLIDGGTDGYYIEIGESGSNDALRLYSTADDSTPILSSADASAASSPSGYVRVLRLPDGTWELYTALDGAPTFSTTPDASAINNDFTDFTANFVLECKYTSGNINNFTFDNIYVGEQVLDLSPPTVLSVTPINATTIEMVFNEPLDPSSVVNGWDTSVDEVVLTDANTLLITLNNPLITGNNEIVVPANISDLAGNSIGEAFVYVFSYYVAAANDIVINEIYADESPNDSETLPTSIIPVEFVELYNQLDFPIQLDGWFFTDSYPTPQAVLDGISIDANAYVVLCSNSAAAELLNLGFANVLGVDGFPSLTNGGELITLADAAGFVVNEVAYSDDWYGDTEKAKGAWSLELINPNNPCSDANNWTASLNGDFGATPNAENSVFDLNSDMQAPQIITSVLDNPEVVQIYFDESIDLASAETLANYSIDNGSAISNVIADDNSVSLFLNPPLQAGTVYTITINNVTDCLGNAIAGATALVGIGDLAATYDVLISEIYADYTPSEGFENPNYNLPDTKFIELYNRSNKVIDLSGFSLSDATGTSDVFGAYLLLPNAYVVLCNSNKVSLFDEQLPVLGVTGFPEPNTGGDVLTIRAADGTVIHSVAYDNSWYNDALKENGQWTLELIDPANPCEGADNWRASIEPGGGTPGAINSVNLANPDTSNPQVVRAEVLDNTHVMVYMSEILALNTSTNPDAYSITGAANIEVASATIADGVGQVIVLELATALSEASLYVLNVTQSVTDCMGNPVMLNNTAQVALTQTANIGDLLINEILFNPQTGGVDFVELYNNSNRAIDLSKWWMAGVDLEIDTSFAVYEAIAIEQYTMFPNTFVVLTENKSDIVERYSACGEDITQYLFIEMDLPTYNDDEDIVAIIADDSFNSPTIMDLVHYYDDWHNPIIDDVNGVSLERISYASLTNVAGSWHSAAAAVCYATPGYVNSQSVEIVLPEENISINPSTFSPDADGIDDFTTITYAFDTPSYIANILIFDERGRQVRTVTQNDVLSTQGAYQWDGTTDEGTKVPVGIYILFVEVFNANGDVQRFKESCVVAGQF